MKLRIALKIRKAVGTSRESSYSDGKITRALDKFDRTRDAKETQRWWDGFMRYLGPEGRADFFMRSGQPAVALDILMRTPEDKWAGDPRAIVHAPPGGGQAGSGGG